MDALLYLGKDQMKSSVFGYPNTWFGNHAMSKNNAVLDECLLPSMTNYCLELVFTFTLQFMRFTFTEQFVNIAKHCGQFFFRLYLRLAGKAPTVLQVFTLGEGNLLIHALPGLITANFITCFTCRFLTYLPGVYF